jgi:hypothetical protein
VRKRTDQKFIYIHSHLAIGVCGYFPGHPHSLNQEKSMTFAPTVVTVTILEQTGPPIHESVEITGTITKFLYNVHGASDGFLIEGTFQVHFSPHIASEILKSVRVGDTVTVHGKTLVAVGLLIGSWLLTTDGTTFVEPAHHSESGWPKDIA